jgi:hypothetical protein
MAALLAPAFVARSPGARLRPPSLSALQLLLPAKAPSAELAAFSKRFLCAVTRHARATFAEARRMRSRAAAGERAALTLEAAPC